MFPYPFLEAAYMAQMMSGGGGGVDDDFSTVINSAPTIVGWTIANGWYALAKIVDGLTIKNVIRYYDSIYTNDYYIARRSNSPPLLMCAYKNGEFMFASRIEATLYIETSYEYNMCEPPYGVQLWKQYDWGYLTNPGDTSTFVPNNIRITSAPTINIPDMSSCTPQMYYEVSKRYREFDVLTGEVIKETVRTYTDQLFGPDLFGDNFTMSANNFPKRDDMLIDLSDACLSYIKENGG